MSAFFAVPAVAERFDPLPSLERGPAEQVETAQRLDKLYADLPAAGSHAAAAIQQEISKILSSHGSPTLDLILQRGRAALSEGDSDAAIGHFTRLIDLAPDFAEAWNMRATAYYLEDRLGESVADIAHVLALEPRHFGALWGLGLILQRTGNDAKALTAFRAAFALNPHLTRGGNHPATRGPGRGVRNLRRGTSVSPWRKSAPNRLSEPMTTRVQPP